jgi:Subtilase family
VLPHLKEAEYFNLHNLKTILNMKKATILLGVLSIVMLIGCQKAMRSDEAPLLTAEGTTRTNNSSEDSTHQFVPNEVLIRFIKGTSENAKANVLAKISGNVTERVVTGAMRRFGDYEGFYVVRTPLQALEAISKVKGLSELEYAEPNFIYNHYATSNDPYFTNRNLWGMYGDASSPANQYGSQAAEAWADGHVGSNTVYIGVIDEGAMYGHPDLTTNFGNLNEIPNDGIDNDGNDFVDDAFGWDFVNNEKTTYDGASDDHGTHVSGTIGARGGNSLGVTGVCWNVQMISAKFLGNRGGTTANAIKAVDYFTNLKVKTGLNIVATNNSWGGGGYSKDMEDAITRAGNAGILFICAAGNDGKNIDQTGNHSFPACYYNWNIIAVAAITSSGGLASYSNYGQVGLNNALGTDPNHSFVDIGAPGSGIYSTVPSKNGTGSSYASYNGTSMATPHVTGAASLYAATHTTALNSITDPIERAKTIKNAILSSASFTSSLNKKCITSGRLNANDAL